MVAILLLIVAIAVGSAAGATVLMRTRRERAARRCACRLTLHYYVPDGCKPAPVAFQFCRAGYEAIPDPTTESPGQVLIGGGRDEPLDREDVRRILARITDDIASASGGTTSAIGFVDE